MSDTLEEVYPQGNKTVGSMKLKKEYLQEKVKEMIPNNNRSNSRKRLP